MNNHKGVDSCPIAIVGFAFRFPGDLADEAGFWEALESGRDLVTQIPGDRWAVNELQHKRRSEPGRSVTFSAGVLSRIDEFDAGFFGVSPREAAWLDPQQRLLLELSWEAMENAGVPPSRLAGTDCAVYVGISSLDYGTRGLDDLASMSSHSMTGNTLSVAANRLSYLFDLHGPSLAVDTACSSSLVALHHACRALQAGEAEAALVGGVSLLLHPYPFVGFTKASMLSADGRCKVFDAGGNGYVRAEGGAMLLLKPLERAIADDDDIHAVVLASGVNADGARKTGITIPSRDGQAELMRAVLAKAGLDPHDIDFVEAHGTGTAVGDPIECAAIGTVYGQGRGTPLPIGSVKANLGHMEAASGMAGLIKAILAIKHQALPAQINLQSLNPHIDFQQLGLQPVTEYMKFDKARPLIAGVNSFGFGGANAHILLQGYGVRQSTGSRMLPESFPPIVLSARADGALRALAARFAEQIADASPEDFYDIAYGAAFRRDRLPKRLAILRSTPKDLAQDLAAYAQGQSLLTVAVEDALQDPGGIAFVYSGNGAQWLGMGRQLLAESPRFLELLLQLDTQMRPVAGFSFMEELQADAESRLEDTVVAQPLLFAVQVALTKLLGEMGIKPVAVTGHSVGEVAAAWAAGALDLDAAIRVIVARSAAQGLTRGTGRMAAVGLGEEALQSLFNELGDCDLTIAGVNSPGNVTISGSLAALQKIEAKVAAKGAFFRLLDLDYAFHSDRMDPIRDILTANLAGLQSAGESSITFVSTVTGNTLDGGELGATYWWRNVREPVRFGDAVGRLAALGCRVFIEIGPHAILQRYITECLASVGVKGRALPTLRKGHDGWQNVVDTALRAQLLVDQPNLSGFFPATGRRIRLPNYPWQRERFWHPRTSESLLAIERRRIHPLLGWKLPEADLSWENVLDPQIVGWLADHRVGGAIVFPGSAYVEMALCAAREWLGGDRLAFEEFDILAPMVFDGQNARTLRFDLNARDGGFTIKSRQRLTHDEWSLHAVGRILQAGDAPLAATIMPPASARRIDRDTHYRLAAQLGLDYGTLFQGLSEAWVDAHVLEGKLVDLPTDEHADYLIHPAQLDICYQSLIDFFEGAIEAGQGVAFLPIKTGRIERLRAGQPHRFRVRLVRRAPRSVLAEFELFDAQDALLARLSGCRFRAAPLARKAEEKISHWRVVPWLSPHPSEDLVAELPGLPELVEALIASPVPARQAWFKEALPLFEALVLSFAFEAMRTLEAREEGALDRLAASDDPYARWLMTLLFEERLLIQREGAWLLAPDADPPAAEEIWRTLVREYPATSPQLVVLGRIGRHLADLLSNVASRQQFLASLWRTPVAETLYDDDPAYEGVRQAIAHILAQLAERHPSYRRLRVLEISAGASELPRAVLDQLSEDRLDYVLALPETLVERQESEYAPYANLSVAAIDLAKWQLVSSTPLPGRFDIVIVRHLLHRAANPKGAIGQLHGWLAAGGCLVVAERHADWSADFLYGLDEMWWHAAAEGDLPNSSLLPPPVWCDALASEGFTGIQSFEEPAADGLAEGAYLLLAQRAGEQPVDMPAVEPLSWLLLADVASKELVQHLTVRLIASGHRVESSEFQPDDLGSFQHVVDLRGWDDAPAAATLRLSHALTLVRALAMLPQPPRLWWVTQGAALCSNTAAPSSPRPVQAALAGFVRVVMNEYASLNSTLIELADHLPPADCARRLENELLYPDGANEILLTRNRRQVPVLREEEDRLATPAGVHERFRLDFHLPGKLGNLRWFPTAVCSPKDNEVEVEVRATGINFRDVMYLMGLLPDEAVENGFAGASLGLEFSGVVTRVGQRVREFKLGDRVMGFGSACFASHVITRADAIAPMPPEWSFEAAATVPTVFFTAYYGLQHLAHLEEGERVLIHGAAGGVGIAAIQLAKHLGAEVFATAGSPEKRDFVRNLGADHVFDSRSLTFADEILAETNGLGVDVVLNSLAGEAMRRSLTVLKPFGRFLELGKRDFFENTPVGLRPFRENISYFGIDADQLLTGRPQLAARLFGEVMTLFREGALAPLPCRVFPAERVVDAFRVMQQARHIGKVVVSLEDARTLLERPKQEAAPIALHPDTTWLVTGGLAGFGLESARWLAKHGVRHLVLVGRRGLDTPGADEAIAELAVQGVKVEAVACDVTDREAVWELVRHIRATLPPLKGVLHAATLYDDALLANLDEVRIERVLNAKLQGGWNFHEATLDIPLEHFVLYSSITTAIGNPGQANYVAANAGLEGLAAHRRAIGLPATCIGWGAIGDSGYLSRNEAVRENLAQRLGKPPLSTEKALGELSVALRQGDTRFVADFDWNALARLLKSSGNLRFALLNRGLQQADLVNAEGDIRALIAGKTPQEAAAIVQGVVIQEIAQILAIAAERIEPSRSLHDLGLDSLMAVELALGLEHRLGVQLPVMMLNESPTAEKVTQRILDKLLGEAGETERAESSLEGVVNALSHQHGEVTTEDELRQLVEHSQRLRQDGVRLTA